MINQAAYYHHPHQARTYTQPRFEDPTDLEDEDEEELPVEVVESKKRKKTQGFKNVEKDIDTDRFRDGHSGSATYHKEWYASSTRVDGISV